MYAVVMVTLGIIKIHSVFFFFSLLSLQELHVQGDQPSSREVFSEVFKRALSFEKFLLGFFFKVLTNLKTNFTKLELFNDLPFPSYGNSDFSLNRLFPL